MQPPRRGRLALAGAEPCSLFRKLSDPSLHAAARVEQKNDIERNGFLAKRNNRLFLSFIEDSEIARLQARHRSVIHGHRGIHVDIGHTRAKCGSLPESRYCQSENNGGGLQNSGHGPIVICGQRPVDHPGLIILITNIMSTYCWGMAETPVP